MPCASRFTQRKPHTRNNKGSQWLPLLSRACIVGSGDARRRSSIARWGDDAPPYSSPWRGSRIVISGDEINCSTARNGDAGQLAHDAMPCMVRARAATWCACSI